MQAEETQAIAVIDRDEKPVLVLQGTIDLFKVDDLYQATHALLERGEDVCLEWEKADRLDTATLQMLLALKKGLEEKGKKMQFTVLSPRLEKHLGLAGFAGVFS